MIEAAAHHHRVLFWRCRFCGNVSSLSMNHVSQMINLEAWKKVYFLFLTLYLPPTLLATAWAMFFLDHHKFQDSWWLSFEIIRKLVSVLTNFCLEHFCRLSNQSFVRRRPVTRRQRATDIRHCSLVNDDYANVGPYDCLQAQCDDCREHIRRRWWPSPPVTLSFRAPTECLFGKLCGYMQVWEGTQAFVKWGSPLWLCWL